MNFVYPQTRRVHEWEFQQNGEVFHLLVDGSLRFDNGEAALEAAIQRAGILQMLNFMAARAISAKVRMFVEFVKELMAKLRREKIVE